MGTFRLKYTDDKKEIFASEDGTNKIYKNIYMDYLISMIVKEQILDAKLKNNNLYLKYSTDIVVLYNFDYYVGDDKYLDFKKAIKDYNDKQIAKNNDNVKKNKNKIKRASSIKSKTLISTLIVSFSLLAFSNYKEYSTKDNNLLSNLNIKEFVEYTKNSVNNAIEYIKSDIESKEEMVAETPSPDIEPETIYQNIELNYKRNYYLTNMQEAEKYRQLAEKYGSKYGIDSNLIIAVMANNGGKHLKDITPNKRVGIMQTAMSRAIDGYYNYYNFNTKTYENRKFTEEELLTIEGNIEAWCIAFQLDLFQNENNIIAALEMNNALDKMNGFFNIAFYEEEKYKTLENSKEDNISLEEASDEITFYRKLALNDYSDFGYLESFKDENGDNYSYNVLSYLPVNSKLIMKTPTENIIFDINNIYNKDLSLNNKI